MADPFSRKIGVRNPRSGQVDYSITPFTGDDVAELASKLKAAQPKWASASLGHRISVLESWADAIERDAKAIGDAECLDTGRFRLSYEVPHLIAAIIRGWCRNAPRIVESADLAGSLTFAPGVDFRTQLVPYQLLGVISPWNHPFLLSCGDAIPALLAGCAAVVKPSEIAPRFVEPVMATIHSVPELAEVFAYVTGGAETGQSIIAQADVICFTGSVPTGRKIAEACARRFIPSFLELGGKDPVIVTASADLDRAADIVLRGAVQNAGQICFSTERVYVADEVHDIFVEKLVERADGLQPNYPDIRQGHIGPFIFEKQADIVDAHLSEALAKGATLRSGGPSVVLGGGKYMPATVLTDVTHDMAVMTEETFGPVVPVMRYRSLEEAVDLANDSSYGLSAAVIAGSADEAIGIAEQLRAGGISVQDVGLNIFAALDAEKTSFGYSGLGGSRMGPNGLLRFLQGKALLIQNGHATDILAHSETARSEVRAPLDVPA